MKLININLKSNSDDMFALVNDEGQTVIQARLGYIVSKAKERGYKVEGINIPFRETPIKFVVDSLKSLGELTFNTLRR
jgi:hypothetical protein